LAGFEPVIPESERMQTRTLDSATTGVSNFVAYKVTTEFERVNST